MYHLATKRTGNNESKKREREFLETQTTSGCVQFHKLYLEESDCIPAVRTSLN